MGQESLVLAQPPADLQAVDFRSPGEVPGVKIAAVEIPAGAVRARAKVNAVPDSCGGMILLIADKSSGRAGREKRQQARQRIAG